MIVQRHFFGFISILLPVPFMNSHVKYATNRESATSRAKNPITSIHPSVTSSSRHYYIISNLIDCRLRLVLYFAYSLIT